jgi:hypothetical protein
MQDRAVRSSPAQLPHFCGECFRINFESAIIISKFGSDRGGFEPLRDRATLTPTRV